MPDRRKGGSVQFVGQGAALGLQVFLNRRASGHCPLLAESRHRPAGPLQLWRDFYPSIRFRLYIALLAVPSRPMIGMYQRDRSPVEDYWRRTQGFLY